MSETICFVYNSGGYEMWRYNKSPYPIYMGTVSEDNLEDEKLRQEAYGYRVWVQ